MHDAVAMCSINIGLNFKESPSKKSACDYTLSTIATIPTTDMTCDVSSDENYGPSHITLLIQYPTFEREVTTIEASMQWQVRVFFLLTAPVITTWQLTKSRISLEL
jgi:hypothetical protein